MKRILKILSLGLALCMLFSIGALASDGPGGPSGGPSGDPPSGGPSGGMGGGSGEPDSYDAVLTLSEDTVLDGESLASESGDESVVHVTDGASVTVANSSIENAGSGSGGDAASFYGVGASLLVTDGTLFAVDDTIESTTSGGAGVFAYGDGVAYVSGCDITTTEGSAGGLHVAGGGTLYAWDCSIETDASMASAAIRSDRGGGTMVIDGGSYITHGGTGAVYVTADITVHDAYLYSGASEAVAIEGKNTIRLFDCDLTGNMQASALNDGNVWNIIVYQSMSGDADVGTSEFDMIGGSLTCNAGPVVYNTNTSSYITFSGVDVTYGDDTTCWLQVTGNSSSRTWGSAGKNGANCVFSAYDQAMCGDVVYDTISNLDFYMLDGSALTGAIVCDDSLNGGYSGSGTTDVYIDESSVWTVTGDSVVTGTLYCAGTIENAVIVDMAGNVLAGEGEYTVTVGAFETEVDASGAGELPVWADYAVENPFAEDGASLLSYVDAAIAALGTDDVTSLRCEYRGEAAESFETSDADAIGAVLDLLDGTIVGGKSDEYTSDADFTLTFVTADGEYSMSFSGSSLETADGLYTLENGQLLRALLSVISDRA